MLFVLTAIDKDNGLDLRKSVRDAHLAFVKETGVVRLGGPFLDAQGNMAGSLIIFEAADMDAAKAWNASDPYMKAGLFKSTDIRPWKATVNACEAKL
ncbi:MAG: YciI family protein [Proteobacteria bacterium]|nr:YciI family protein [Pseudomonadota bacterium]